MRKLLSFLSFVMLCVGFNISALAETVVLSPENVSDADIKTSQIVSGLNTIQWVMIVIGAIVLFFALIIFINKQRDKKQSKD